MKSEDIERVQKTLETIQVRLPRCIQVVTSLIPALFVTVLRTGKPSDITAQVSFARAEVEQSPCCRGGCT